jgi:hypothetical protein
MAHTPGPWSLLDESEIHHEGAMIANVMMADDFPCLDQDDEALIAKVEAECHANARLIKAAPNLLAALKEVVAISDRKHDAWDKAHAAIAEAEGA